MAWPDPRQAVLEPWTTLAGLLGLLLGITVTAYGAAMLADRRASLWLGLLALAGGVPTAIGGVMTAYVGFSGTAMVVNMVGSVVVLVWVMGVGARVKSTLCRSAVNA